MINKNIHEFTILYTNPIPKMALGWGAHQTVADFADKIEHRYDRILYNNKGRL